MSGACLLWPGNEWSRDMNGTNKVAWTIIPILLVVILLGGNGVSAGNFGLAITPEPSSWLLAGLGLLGAFTIRRRR